MLRRLLLILGLPLLAVSFTSVVAASGFDAAQYVGTYRGTWKNTVNGESGPGSVTVEIDEARRTATLVVDLDGRYLGIDNPPPARIGGTFTDSGAVIRGQDNLIGSYDVTIDADGRIRGLLKGLAGGTIPQMTYNGRLTADAIDIEYQVTLSDGTVSRSNFHARKVPGPRPATRERKPPGAR